MGVRRALARRGGIRPYRHATPITLEATFKNDRPAELLEYLPITVRPEARTIHYRGIYMAEISGFLQFVLNYQPDLSP
jgi:D-amino peptidase